MNSRQITESQTIAVSYWSCFNGKHRHKTQAIANACIAKALKPKRVTVAWTPALRREVFMSVLDGGSYADAAKLLGLTRTRVRQVVLKMARLMWLPEGGDRHRIESLRENRSFWLRRLDEVKY